MIHVMMSFFWNLEYFVCLQPNFQMRRMVGIPQKRNGQCSAHSVDVIANADRMATIKMADNVQHAQPISFIWNSVES